MVGCEKTNCRNALICENNPRRIKNYPYNSRSFSFLLSNMILRNTPEISGQISEELRAQVKAKTISDLHGKFVALSVINGFNAYERVIKKLARLEQKIKNEPECCI